MDHHHSLRDPRHSGSARMLPLPWPCPTRHSGRPQHIALFARLRRRFNAENGPCKVPFGEHRFYRPVSFRAGQPRPRGTRRHARQGHVTVERQLRRVTERDRGGRNHFHSRPGCSTRPRAFLAGLYSRRHHGWPLNYCGSRSPLGASHTIPSHSNILRRARPGCSTTMSAQPTSPNPYVRGQDGSWVN